MLPLLLRLSGGAACIAFPSCVQQPGTPLAFERMHQGFLKLGKFFGTLHVLRFTCPTFGNT